MKCWLVHRIAKPKDRVLSSRLSINGYTMPGARLDDEVEMYESAGISGIGVLEEKLESGREREQAELVAAAGLQTTTCGLDLGSVLPVSFFGGGPADPRERVGIMVESIKRFKPFRPQQFVAFTGYDDSLDSAARRRAVVDGFRRLGAAAGEIGAVVAIEPFRIPGGSIVRSLADTADLVDEIDMESVGVSCDLWHLWDSPTLLEDISSYVSLLTVVQISDWPDKPDPGFEHAVPGDGVIAFEPIFAALESAGYSGWYDIEVFAPPQAPGSIPRSDHEELLRRSLESVEASWAAAGV